jgi:hypothetical protein
MATLGLTEASLLSESEHQVQLRRAVIASTIGTAIEWYDFFLYSTMTRWHWRSPQLGQPRLDLWIGEACIDLCIQLRDDLSGYGLGRADTKARAHLVARHEIGHRWDVRQRQRARRSRHC